MENTEKESRTISSAVIGRLPRYYRYLEELQSEGIERISSGDLSRLMHVTASQIRQDLNHFGGFGQQGYGYNVRNLYEEIGSILGLDHSHSMVLVGAGNLGQALVHYMNFRNRGFYFMAAFEIRPDLIGGHIGEVPVYSVHDLKDYLTENPAEIAVLTIPKQAALEVAPILVETPIRAIWNFAHIDLRVPERIKVENVHLSDSLMRLSYTLGHSSESGEEDHE